MSQLRILVTGGSSFSGLWFGNELARAGHLVTAPVVRNLESYSGTRRKRVELLQQFASVEWQCPFGSDRFLELVEKHSFDVLCCHGAQVLDHRSLDFDIVAALADNIRGLPQVLQLMLKRGLTAVVLTGTFSEQDEGAGTGPLSAFQPYSLSKGLTAQVFRYWTSALGVRLGKFVMPNPFGPLEEERFVAHLVRSWRLDTPAKVHTPRYVRDNAPIALLAATYRDYVERLVDGRAAARTNPSGYIETQGDFAQRVARELGHRLKLATPLELAEQTDFREPMMRVNTEPMDWKALGLSEAASWDQLARYYSEPESALALHFHPFQ